MGDDITARDPVWSEALELALNARLGTTGFKTHHVWVNLKKIDDPPSHKTVQRTLRAMAALGWLSHKPGSPRYRAGPKLERLRE